MRRRVTLIANARSGRASFEGTRGLLVRSLGSRGWDVSVAMTTPDSGSAQRLASEAAQSSDMVLACGGDGTVNEVLQGVAGTGCHLGVLPFGTANALARNLLLSSDPATALTQLLTYEAKQIPLGQVLTSGGERLFTVVAGSGPDGALVREMVSGSKARFGRSAYYATAAKLLALRQLPSFQVDFRPVGSQEWHSATAAGMMVSRVPNLGGGFRALTRASRLQHPYLQLQIIGAPALVGLPAWFVSAHLRLGRWNRLLHELPVSECRCIPLGNASTVFAQVDGEAIGSIPIHVRVASTTAWLLMPALR